MVLFSLRPTLLFFFSVFLQLIHGSLSFLNQKGLLLFTPSSRRLGLEFSRGLLRRDPFPLGMSFFSLLLTQDFAAFQPCFYAPQPCFSNKFLSEPLFFSSSLLWTRQQVFVRGSTLSFVLSFYWTQFSLDPSCENNNSSG